VRAYAFHHVDVFTRTPFEGNPLAVFNDARGLDDAMMQRIAGELNLSETVFVFPAVRDDSAGTLRIFTPAAELQFAGHPTIGTAYVLHATGALATNRRSFVFEEGIGPVSVRIDDAEHFTAWLTTPPVTLGPQFADRDGVAAALGIATADLLNAPVQVASAGNPFVYVALRDVPTVDRASLDARAARAVFGEHAASGVYVFAVRPGGVYSRMFAPEHGIIEDPATGSATGPLATFVLAHGLVEDADTLELTAEQGTRMGRRSLLRIRTSGSGVARRIEVGGSAVGLIDGVLRLE